MSLLPRIACITITHSRVDMLKRSMKCFLEQTYSNKESIIFFTEHDLATAQLVNNHPEYSLLHLRQQETNTDVYLVSADDEMKSQKDFQPRERIYLKNLQGQYLIRKGHEELLWAVTPDASSILELIKEGQRQYLRASESLWIKLTAEHQLIATGNHLAAEVHTVLMADSRIKLINEKSFLQQSRLKQMGFDLKTVRETDSLFIFVQLFAHETISLGAKRNLAMECTNADYICVWDDDDWYDERRMEHQMGFLQFTNKVACSMANTILFDHNTNQGYINGARREGWEQTLMCKKTEMAYYGNLNRSEDTPVLKDLFELNKLAVIEEPSLYIYNVHAFNTCPSEHFLRMINNFQTKPLSKEENEKAMSQLGIL